MHPWFANVSASQSAGWTANFFQTVDIAAADAQSNKPKMYIAETGWPSVSYLAQRTQQTLNLFLEIV